MYETYHFSVPYKFRDKPVEIIHGLVKASNHHEALNRLRRDDPIWNQPNVILEKTTQEDLRLMGNFSFKITMETQNETQR